MRLLGKSGVEREVSYESGSLPLKSGDLAALRSSKLVLCNSRFITIVLQSALRKCAEG